MKAQERFLFIVAGIAGIIGVAFEALAAHENLTNIEWLQTAGNMLLFHAPVLAALGATVMFDHAPRRILTVAGALLFLGLLFFCGDLAYAVFFHTQHIFPYAAPIGGVLLMLGWLGVAAAGVAVVKEKE
jgi:uncharacterized membrane protein YgdD (TMEM256/DUF423 family)